MKTMAQKTTFQHDRLASLREAFEITQQELADAIRPEVKTISRELIKDFEIGSRIPKIDVVVAFANYFTVSTDYLFGLTVTPTIDTDIRMICEYTGLSETVIQSLHRRNDAREENIELWGNIDATDEMLGILLNLPNDGISLSIPIVQKANRIAIEYIAKQIIEDPKRFVPVSKDGEVVLQKILQYISIYSGVRPNNQRNESEKVKVLTEVTAFLGRYIDVQGNSEFDRFTSTQHYLDAYDTVMAKYPERKLIELQKSGLLGNLCLRFIPDAADSNK